MSTSPSPSAAAQGGSRTATWRRQPGARHRRGLDHAATITRSRPVSPGSGQGVGVRAGHGRRRQVTWVEVWRDLGRRLTGADAPVARDAFRADWAHLTVVEIDAVLAEGAGRIADLTGSRSLDAVHLAAMQRAGPSGITLVTADLRQAQAARSLGWSVLGA